MKKDGVVRCPIKGVRLKPAGLPSFRGSHAGKSLEKPMFGWFYSFTVRAVVMIRLQQQTATGTAPQTSDFNGCSSQRATANPKDFAGQTPSGWVLQTYAVGLNQRRV